MYIIENILNRDIPLSNGIVVKAYKSLEIPDDLCNIQEITKLFNEKKILYKRKFVTDVNQLNVETAVKTNNLKKSVKQTKTKLMEGEMKDATD